MQNHVIVHKDKKARSIKTYVSLESIGASTEVHDFIRLVAEKFGSPAMTFKKATFEAKLLEASNQAILHMKQQTREVAAINLEPVNPGQG